MERKNYPIIIHDHHCLGPNKDFSPVSVRIEIYELDSSSYEHIVAKCERYKKYITSPDGSTILTYVCLDGTNLDKSTEEAFNQFRRCHRAKLVANND